jgi:hypothetical protein
MNGRPSNKKIHLFIYTAVRGSTVGSGTALQAGRSLSLGVDSASSTEGKSGRCIGLTTMPLYENTGPLNVPETLGPVQG